MGMTKALMEKVTIATSRNVNERSTMMCNTRYGNVMASRGSVIPLFIEQIKKGETITITDPEMTRFMMSLPEAVDLVLYAFEHGHSGDTFVQKAPAATILTLGRGFDAGFPEKVEIKIIGTRHGERSTKPSSAGRNSYAQRTSETITGYRRTTEILFTINSSRSARKR
jgi:UDP-glucose 4-epimerase